MGFFQFGPRKISSRRTSEAVDPKQVVQAVQAVKAVQPVPAVQAMQAVKAVQVVQAVQLCNQGWSVLYPLFHPCTMQTEFVNY